MLWAVMGAGLAAWWATGSPTGQLSRLDVGRQRPGVVGVSNSARSPSRFRWLASACAFLVTWVLASGLGWLVAPLSMGAALAAYWWAGRHETRQARVERQRLQADLPQALQFLAVCLAAGAPLRRAVAEVASISSEPTASLLRGVEAHTAIGITDAEAWRTLRGHPVWGAVARDLARSVDSGTTVVGVLRQHAADAARIHRDQLTTRARTVGVKSAAPLMCCFLPAFILIGVVPIVAGLLEAVLGW